MKIIIVIPARFKSSRFPGKPLVKILDKPMIQWVAELSEKAVSKENVYIATDNIKIFNVVSELGYKGIMTSEKCLTGTDRLAEVAKKVEADIYINVQGDEPMVKPNDIQKIIDAKKKYPHDIINGYTRINKEEDASNINLPKVIFTDDKRLVYISRKALPGFKDKENEPQVYYKQVCIYAFNRQELLEYARYGCKSILEQSEDIEILRFLEWGKTIRLVKTSSGSISVDEAKDIKKAEFALRKIEIDKIN